ncbi:MAG: hypothetical protein MI754_02870, partial [Chromatiales bacterium]|nr:hypothetical protein [Chromatiales bacterium]
MIRHLFKLTLLLLLLVLVGLGWLLGTTQGNRLLLTKLPIEELKIEQVDGLIWSDLSLGKISYNDGAIELLIDNLKLSWQPKALLDRLVHVKALTVGDITFTQLKASEESSSEPTEIVIPEIPVAIQLDQVTVNAFTLHSADGQQVVDNIAAQLGLQNRQITIGQLAAQYQDFAVITAGDVSLTEQLPFALSLDWQGTLPDIGELAGSGKLSGDLTAINLNHQLNQPAQLTTDGDIRLGEDQITLDIKGGWDRLGWPLSGEQEYLSQQGQYTVSGTIDQLHVTLDSDLSSTLPDIPPMALQLATDVTDTGLENLDALVKLLDGETQITGKLGWAPYPSWQLAIDGQALKPDSQWPDLSAVINLQAEVSGQLENETLQVDSQIRQLHGTLRNYPIKGSGRVQVNGDQFSFEAINLESGPNRLSIDGKLGELADIVFSLDAPDLSTLAPQLSGQLSTQGTLKGALDNPQVALTAKASALQFEENSIEQADIDLNWNSNQAEIRINAKRPTVPGWEGEFINLSVTGKPEQHTIDLALADSEAILNAKLSGGWQQPLWQGELLSMTGEHPLVGAWQSSEKSQIKAGEQQFVLDRLCLTQSSAQICSSVSWQPAQTLIDSTITQLPLTLLSRWLPEEAEIKGAIDATLKVEQAGEQLQGSAELLLESGAVSMALEEPEKLELKLHQGAVKATFNQSTVQSDLSLNIGDTGTLKGNAEITLGETPEATRLSGHYNFQLPDLEPLRILIPDLVNLDGELTGDVTLAGTQAAPKIEGEVALTNATTAIPDLGVEFTDINLTVTSDD